MKLDVLIKCLPIEKEISEDEAVELLRKAGVNGPRMNAEAALAGMAFYGLVMRPGGPYRPNVKRVKDPAIDQPREKKVPTQQFHPIGPDSNWPPRTVLPSR